jgi:hypothetical protein
MATSSGELASRGAGFATAGFTEAGLATAGFTEAAFATAGFTEAGFAMTGFTGAGFATTFFEEAVALGRTLGTGPRLVVREDGCGAETERPVGFAFEAATGCGFLLEPGFDAELRVAFTEFAILRRRTSSGPVRHARWVPLI